MTRRRFDGDRRVTYTPAMIRAMRALYATGASARAVAEAFGLPTYQSKLNSTSRQPHSYLYDVLNGAARLDVR